MLGEHLSGAHNAWDVDVKIYHLETANEMVLPKFT